MDMDELLHLNSGGPRMKENFSFAVTYKNFNPGGIWWPKISFVFYFLLKGESSSLQLGF